MNVYHICKMTCGYRQKSHITLTKTNQYMLFREIIDVYFKTTRKTLLHSVYKTWSILMLQGMVHVITTGLEMVKTRFSFTQ